MAVKGVVGSSVSRTVVLWCLKRRVQSAALGGGMEVVLLDCWTG